MHDCFDTPHATPNYPPVSPAFVGDTVGWNALVTAFYVASRPSLPEWKRCRDASGRLGD